MTKISFDTNTAAGIEALAGSLKACRDAGFTEAREPSKLPEDAAKAEPEAQPDPEREHFDKVWSERGSKMFGLEGTHRAAAWFAWKVRSMEPKPADEPLAAQPVGEPEQCRCGHSRGHHALRDGVHGSGFCTYDKAGEIACQCQWFETVGAVEAPQEIERKECADEYCDHKECWDAAKARVRENINSSRKEWRQEQKAAREPKPAPQATPDAPQQTISDEVLAEHASDKNSYIPNIMIARELQQWRQFGNASKAHYERRHESENKSPRENNSCDENFLHQCRCPEWCTYHPYPGITDEDKAKTNARLESQETFVVQDLLDQVHSLERRLSG